MSAMRTASRPVRRALLLATLLAVPAAAQLQPHADDPGDCLRCHEQVQAEVARPVPHDPAASGACADCHSPHASRHPHLLRAGERALCFTCHGDKAGEFLAGEVHTPVKEGRCTGCHEVHGALHADLLAAEGNGLCLGCHERQHQEAARPVVHGPFRDGGCLDCHQAHSSPHAAQLMAPSPALCTVCHDATDPDLSARHAGMAVAETQCTDCHAPHASVSKGLLREVVHAPFAEGSCDLCHMVDSDTPQVLLMTGARLCQTCHQDTPPAGDTLVHAPVAGGECLACHATHASSHDGLLVAGTGATCLSCHQEIRQRAETARTVHQVYDEDGSCLGCHRPHSSKEDHLLTAGEIRTCLVCHENQRHGHPLGSDRIDPRTGKGITCVTCHDPHGTDFPMQLRGDQSRGLCLECHSQEGQALGQDGG